MPKFTQLSLEDYLEELSGPEPVPGGGSVSAYVTALAMGLTQMVGRISLKRKKKAATPEEEKEDERRRETLQKIVDALEKTKRDAFQIVDLDPKIYGQVAEAWGKPEKQEDALLNSFRLQADLALLAVIGREWNAAMSGLVTGSIKNDLLVSAGLFEAGFRGAYYTAMINAKYMKDAQNKERSEKGLDELKKRFEKGAADVREYSQKA